LKLQVLSLVLFGEAAASMVSSFIPKRVCTARLSNPLGNAGILQQVLEYAGTRSYLYIGAVSSLWKQCYETVATAEYKSSYGAALQSVATLTWAYTSGLQLQADN
jgi:hypothetical protein